jgi:hypothetical protein
MNESVMGEWVEEVWTQRAGATQNPDDSVLILDSAPCHKTDLAKQAVQDCSKMAMIPGGLTKKLQPLDLSVNKSFKSKMRYRWERWMMDDSKHTFTKSGKQRHATLLEVCEWVEKSCSEIAPACVKNGFRKMFGDDQDSDSSDSNSDESDVDMDDGTEDLQNRISGIGFYSSDEFDGFNDSHIVRFDLIFFVFTVIFRDPSSHKLQFPRRWDLS